nr:MarR family transcriptional regulator [uncultured Bacillus sp.]
METDLQHLDCIDLLSERYIQLRGITEKLWNNTSDIYISNSEWFIMGRIYKKQTTIAYIAKRADISRQAVHKFIKNLEAKGLVEISSQQHNKKDKCIQLTKLGEECYEKNAALKAELEKKITDKIGAAKLEILKEILKLDWGL